MKIILGIVVLVVVVIGAIVAFGSASDDTSSSSAAPGVAEASGSPSLSATPVPVPVGDKNRAVTMPPSISPNSRAPAKSAIGYSSFGPYLVAEGVSDETSTSYTQQQVFRAPDGTLAILYHRPGGSRAELDEIVLVHSHDGGQAWHGELSIGIESRGATYSGTMNAEGDLFVVYGQEGVGSAGGAIKLQSLFYDDELHQWVPGPVHQIVGDWPGQGTGDPVLAFTGDRLWLAYRHYSEKDYNTVLQYADPDSKGDYPAFQWSRPLIMVGPVQKPAVHLRLVSHGTSLSAIYTTGRFDVRWRLLRDPQGKPKAWSNARMLVDASTTVAETSEVTFSGFRTSVDTGEQIHLVFGVENYYVGYINYDGEEWSVPRLLASDTVRGPAIANDGQNVWAFWERTQLSGYTQIEMKKWTPELGWDRASTVAWPEEYGDPFPSVITYSTKNQRYTDNTRISASVSLSGAGQQAMVARILKRSGDILYLGNDQKFGTAPLGLDQQPPGAPQLNLNLEYWNGVNWASLQLPEERSVIVNRLATATQTLPPISSIVADDQSETDFDRLITADESTTTLGAALKSYEFITFSPPQDWQPTEVNGDSKYYLRLRKEQVSDAVWAAFKFRWVSPLRGLLAVPTAGKAIDLLWTERSPSGDKSRLWFGAVSLDGGDARSRGPQHTHDVQQPAERLVGTLQPKPVPLPTGLSRQYVSQALDVGERYNYQLLDGQVRHVTVLGTRRELGSSDGVTIWATATVEVSGPGLEPKQAVIPAAYFQTPVILNGVRIYVEITEEFNEFRLVDGGETNKAARLMLSDARYTLTDLEQYRWPFPGMLWGLGSFNSYYQTLEGSLDSPVHTGVFVQDMPAGTPVQAWKQGTFSLQPLYAGWMVSLNNTGDGRSREWHRASALDQVDLERHGTTAKLGDQIGVIARGINAPPFTWGAGKEYDWALVMAEWYVAQSTPVERSYVKDWLVLGPYKSSTVLSPLSVSYIPDEATIVPLEGDAAPGTPTWQRFDGIVPGVVDVADAVSGFRNSGWARVNNNFPDSVAYLATYIYSPTDRSAVLHIGSSDRVKVWLGSKVVLERNSFVRVRQYSDWSIRPDFYQVPVALEKGWNRVLLKLSQGRTSFSGPESAQSAWQLSFRVSDQAGSPFSDLVISPERDRSADPLAYYAINPIDVAQMNRVLPPAIKHEWPEKADLSIGESFTYSLLDGSERTLKLLSYNIVIPRHKIEATVEVSGNGKTETHTVQVALGGVPVSLNGLRVYAYAWREANRFGFEKVGTTGDFPLTLGKDVGFAVGDASVNMFPDLDSYTFPFDIAFFEGDDFQSWLEIAGENEFVGDAWAHSGYDAYAPANATLSALHDGTVWYGDGTVWLATTSGEKWDDPSTWLFTHVLTGTAQIPNGTFVKKGTPIASGGSHIGSTGSRDFGSWLFMSQIWNNEHRDDFPAPRYWLALGPYDGNLSSNYIADDESGSIPEILLPRKGSPSLNGDRLWKFADNFVNSVTVMGELLSQAPFSGHPDRKSTNTVGYAATYIYSGRDHTTNNEAHLKWGANHSSKVWLNGLSVFEFADEPGGSKTIIDQYDLLLPLKKGWNVLIIKTNTGDQRKLSRFSAKIGDSDGNRIADLRFSTRNINARIGALTADSISLSWSDPDFHGTHVETYKLDVATDANFADLVVRDLDIGKVTSYTIPDLKKGQEYFIRIKPYSYSEMGGSVYWQHFDVVSARTSNILAPTNLTVRAGAGAGAAKVSLTWTGSAGISSYKVKRAMMPQGPFSIIAPSIAGTTYIDTSVSVESTYYYVVSALNRKGESGPSKVAAATTRSKITTPTIFPIGSAISDGAGSGGLEWLRVEGNKILDESGRTVVLRGATVENFNWIWAGDRNIDFERIAIPKLTGASPSGWGANLVVIDFAATPVNRGDPDYLGFLDEFVSMATANRSYVMLNFRWHEPMVQPSKPTPEGEEAFGRLAERYKNDPAVIFNLMEEPHDGVTWEELLPLYTSMIDTIRAQNPRALISVPGTAWGRYVLGAFTDPVPRDNLIYMSSSFDSWEAIVNGNDYLLPLKWKEIAAIYPLIIGGFGSGSSEFEQTIEDVRTLLDFADELGISWAGWLFLDKGCPCMLQRPWQDFIPTAFGAEVKNRLQR